MEIFFTISKNTNKEHPENQDRINISIDYLKKSNKLKDVLFNDSDTIFKQLQHKLGEVNKEEIAKIILSHGNIYSTSYYINNIKNRCQKLSTDKLLVVGDVYLSNVTFNEIVDNSIIIYYVCEKIGCNILQNAYCMIRPPSHHSAMNYYSGFCIINHTYLAAKYMHDKYNKKVLILDYDVHHGDGTETFVRKNYKDEVYFVSMHCYEKGFYPGTGSGKNNNNKVKNIPLPRGLKDYDYIKVFNDRVIPFIIENKFDIIIISNGLDAHVDDPFRVMLLTNKFYKYVTCYLKSLNIPLLYVLEGGYNPKTIGSVSEDILEILNKKKIDN